MPIDAEHQVIIRRRGISHRACCPCGWSGHAWNDLRPAEADAWEHLYGTGRIVDASAIPGPGDAHMGGDVTIDIGRLAGEEPPGRRAAAPQLLADRAIELAASPSPYGRRGPAELWELAGRDLSTVRAALDRITELLADHSRRSAGTADGQWLELITAKRLLEETVREAGVPSSR